MTEPEKNSELARHLVDRYNSGTADWVGGGHCRASEAEHEPPAELAPLHARSLGYAA